MNIIQIFYCSILLILLSQTNLFAQNQNYKYILFDKENLLHKINESLWLDIHYAEIEDSLKKFPNQTVYNYYFKKTNSIIFFNKKNVNSGFKKAFLGNTKEFPYDLLVTITPLAKGNHIQQDITDRVEKGEIKFHPIEDIYFDAIKNLYLGKYAPLGIFDTIPIVRNKITDYKIVVKENNKFIMLNDTTLSERYYIGMIPLNDPSEYSSCGVYIYNTPIVRKSLDKTPEKLNPLVGKIVVEKIDTIRINLTGLGHFYVNNHIYGWSYQANTPYFTSYPLKWNDFIINDGIGDFKFVQNLGMVAGNFADYFIRSGLDIEAYPKYTLRFKTKYINGIDSDTYLKTWGGKILKRYN